MRSLTWPLLLLLLAGCPGTLADFSPFRDSGNASCDIPQLFATQCAMSGCHTGSAAAANLDLASPGVEVRLVGKTNAMCGGLLVDSRNPAESVFYKKLSDKPPCGTRMPPSVALSAQDQQCILTWIGSVGAGGSDAARQ